MTDLIQKSEPSPTPERKNNPGVKFEITKQVLSHTFRDL